MSTYYGSTTMVLDATFYTPSYGNLPMEILLHIFDYLDHTDLLTAGLVCMRWHEALLHPQLNHRTVVHFAKERVSDHLPQAMVFLRSERPYRSVYMEEVTFGPVYALMGHWSQSLHELTLDNVDMGDKQFHTMMQQLTQLQRLTVTRCSQLFMPGSFLDGNECAEDADKRPIMANVRHLSLHQNQYLSDAILQRITALLPRIESLDLSGCYVAYHNALHRRFYPNDPRSNMPSDSILTFKFILRVLGEHRAHLRELNLSQTLIGGPAMQALTEMESDGDGDNGGGGLELQRLRLAECRQLNVATLRGFLQTQSQLLVLDLSDVQCVNDACLQMIVTANPLLEELLVAGCGAISNNVAALLGTMKRLWRLDISRCGDITTDGLKRGIAHTRNPVLQELYMSSLKVCDEGIKCVARNLPELRVLHVNNCVNGVGDESVQCIIEHLRWLRELSLEDCFRVTDAALTGINVAKLGLKTDSNNSLHKFNPPPTSSIAERESLNGSLYSLKISLRSKAEEDIVRDANRKNAMFAAYELNLIDESNIEGFCIKQLCGLNALNLKGCNKITDVSLKYGMKFLELRRLSLSNCQQISYIGMETLVQNCPSIEDLDLSDCYNINDKTIQVLTAKLKRLRALHLSGCTQLTDHSVDAILVNCKCLQTLSAYRCRHMYTNIEDRLAPVPTLRNLIIDNASVMDTAEIFRLRKAFDY